MSITLAVLSQKGGTGKTTTVRSLADVLGRVGLDVLAIDADPQGNLSDYFDVDPEAQPTLGEVLAGAPVPPGELVVYCAAGVRSAQAVQALLARGVPAVSLRGGYQGWSLR